MGLILDTSLLIASERRRDSAGDLFRKLVHSYGSIPVALSAVSAVELTHGIYRARSEAERARRRIFASGLFNGMRVHPVALEVAELAGRVEGEQAALGIAIPFEDLLIGATALRIGFAVATLNAKHFARIPGLSVVTPGA